MKYASCATVLAFAAALTVATAANLRVRDDVEPARIVASKTVVAVAVAGNSSSTKCLNGDIRAEVQASTTSKLRVCNAVTTIRTAVISVFLNGKELTKDSIDQRKCIEFVIPITKTNKLEVKLTGEALADWSAEKTDAEMMDAPILFLVAHVFGEGDSSTFSVDEFQGENNGLNAPQVAYMDLYRGAPGARLQLTSPGGEFEMPGGTYMPLCAGKYSLQFVQDGQKPRQVSAPAHFKPNEQYVIMRLAPENRDSDGAPAETAMVFPDTSTGSGFPWLSQ